MDNEELKEELKAKIEQNAIEYCYRVTRHHSSLLQLNVNEFRNALRRAYIEGGEMVKKYVTKKNKKNK